jgi:hypothetical protein
MKFRATYILTLLLAFGLKNVQAQVPEGFNFQGLASTSIGVPIIDAQIDVKIDIIKDGEEAIVVYSEVHTVNTNALGVFNLVIGDGMPDEGNNFSSINWAEASYSVGVHLDATSTGNFERLGESRLLSVPYALMAKNVMNGGGNSGNPFTDFIQINTDDESLQDSLTIIRMGSETEEETAYALNVIGFSSGRNRPVLGQIRENSGNMASQYAVSGRADGSGGGTHIGVLGSAFNIDAVNGGARYGLYGQAASQSKYNFGAYTYSTGAGNGELVPIGEEVDGNFGTYNIGYGTFVAGNTNGNTGIDVQVSGNQGERINIGAEVRVSTAASGQNSGLQAIVNGSSTLNRGFWGLVNGDNNNVGLELTVDSGTSNKGIIVSADSAAFLNGYVEINGNTNVNGFLTATTVTETSDRRLKANIQPLQNSLNNALQLRGVSYNWVDTNQPQTKQIGLIAQEVEEIYPEFVLTDAEGMKSVNYSQMVAVLIEAVKELNAKIEALENENSELRAQAEEIETIKRQLYSIVKLMNAEGTVQRVPTPSTDR